MPSPSIACGNRVLQRDSRAAFSLVELLVVVGIISALVAILLPAVQTAREAANRAACQNNARQINVAILLYEGQHQRFPVGAASNMSLIGPSMGVSWMVYIAPFLEGGSSVEEIDPHARHAGFAIPNKTVAEQVDGVRLDSLLCPSSPLPEFQTVGNVEILRPSYVGIAGATGDDSFNETRTSACCEPRLDGFISSGGILFPNGSVTMEHISDGASKTLCFSEASEYAITDKGKKAHIDGGATLGWIAGTIGSGTPPDYLSTKSHVRNVTTLRYAPNDKNYMQPGIGFGHGANNPLISPHPGGVTAGLCDGSVMFLSESIDLRALKAMATRDDGTF